jgi:rhodanese-related sulfurtransferase
MNPEDYPEISPQELAEKLQNDSHFHLLDVRELWELDHSQIRHPRVTVIAMSQMAREREEAFPPELRDLDADIVVMCHHGVRSMQVTQWMRSLGWKKVFSLAGGIDAYASQIDPSVGFY